MTLAEEVKQEISILRDFEDEDSDWVFVSIPINWNDLFPVTASKEKS